MSEPLDLPFLATRDRLLDQLVRLGNYGNSRGEVADYLVMRGLDDLIRAGVIGPKPAADEPIASAAEPLRGRARRVPS